MTTHAAARHPLTALAWFAAMVAGWMLFWTLALASETALEELWHGVRDLPLLLEIVVWLAAFPFVLALGIWNTGWSAETRVAFVVLCTVAWSLGFWPWRRSGR